MQELLVVFVHLCILLEQLAQVRVEVVRAVTRAIRLALLSRRLRPIKDSLRVAGCVETYIATITTVIDSRSLLHETLGEASRWALASRPEAHGREALILLRCAHLRLWSDVVRGRLVAWLGEVAHEGESVANVLVLILIVL